MRRWHRYLALAVVVSACSGGGSDGAADSSARSTLPAIDAASTTTSSGGSASSTSTATATSSAATTTTATTSPSTTTPATTTPATTTLDTSNLPSCTDRTSPGTCQGATVPLPPDAEVILSRYRAFAQKQLEVMSNPDAPDWEGLLAFVLPRQREAARADVQQRFDRGEILNVSLGVTIAAQLSRLEYPEDMIEVVDCRVDGSYWMDRASGTPVAGEIAEARPRVFNAVLRRSEGVWYISGYDYLKGNC